MHRAFSLLAEPIRRVLWDLRWNELRPIQDAAIRSILKSDRDLIISARTASGKTEAAFLPVLSSILEAPFASIRAVYVGPLKALINDQFRRMEDLCVHARIPVHRWHGDVAQGKKKALLKRPSGVLLITPESMESLFVNHSTALSHLFHSLSFVVIDELHALHGSERGTHLRSLLHRLDRVAVNPPRLVALSATLGDPQLSAEWLRPENPDRVELIEDSDDQKSIRYRIFAYRRASPKSKTVTGTVSDASAIKRQTPGDQVANVTPTTMVAEMYEAFRRNKNLLFANSRSDVEWYADLLNNRAAEDGQPGQFLVHHGSLSAEIREHTERLMQGDRPFSTLCSSTLELGIDIGNVAAVGQIGCPWSVNSLVQRLGRSGREEGEPQSMRLHLLEDELEAGTHLCEQLRPRLLQAVALTELMLKKWVEPSITPRGDLSTLLQQILSVLAETGGTTAAELHERLGASGGFQHIRQSIFLEVLRSMGDRDLIEQMPQGDLILGLAGQEIVGHYDFYSAFATPPEFRVSHQGKPLGMLPTLFLPNVGDHFLLAGRRWQVADIDHDRREISVRPSRGRKAPLFTGSGEAIHAKIRETMREVLLGKTVFSYLNEAGTKLLEEARDAAIQAGLRESDFVSLSPSQTLWLTWTGTNIQQTLLLMFKRMKLEAVDREFAIELGVPLAAARVALETILENPPNAASLAALCEAKERRKYDRFLSKRLLEYSLGEDVINVSSALSCIRNALC